jgi:DNA modification methylase
MKNQEVNFISPSELKVSEHYEKVYGKNEAIDPLLKETIQKEGIKEPLIITKANNIVSGVLRWRIAMDLSQNPQHQRKFQVVPVIYTESEDTSTEIIIHNQGRTKTYTQKLKEFKILKDEFLPGRGYRSDMKVEKVKNKEKLEDVLGESTSTLNRLLYIDSNINDACKGVQDEVKLKWELLDKGKLSVTGLYNWVKNQIEQNEKPESDTYTIGKIKLLNKSCKDLKDLKNNSVNCVISSPPYWDMALYNNGREELGKEKEVDDYISNLSKLLDNVKGKLTKDGSLIVNISDVVKKGEMCLVPHRLVMAMSKLNWKVNTTIVWSKTNPQFSGKGIRPNPSHEFIFQFFKENKPHYDANWVKECEKSIAPIKYGKNNGEVNLRSKWSFDITQETIETAVNNLNPVKRALAERNIKLTHPAIMNDLVASILIRTFTKPGDTVVDLFNGINTTGIRCQELGRNFIGFEENPDYFLQGIERTKAAEFNYDIELEHIDAA